jgi:hypothetical protein
MATLTAQYLPDLGRVRITLGAPLANVEYTLQRSTDGGVTWVDVRGGLAMGTNSVTVVDDFEYTPNVRNDYRVLAPVFYDSFNRAYPSASTLQLTGASDSYASTPDHASLDLTGDLDMRADVTATWTGMTSTLIGKYVTTGNQRSYRLVVIPDGKLRTVYSTDGSNALLLTSTVPIPITQGRLSVRATLDADNGAGGHTATFYTSTGGISGPWVQLGAAITNAGTLTLFSGTAPLEVGASTNGTQNRLTGQVHAAQLRSSIGGVIVANPDFSVQPPGTVNFVDSTGKTWTLGASASIVTIAPVPGTDWGTTDTGQTWTLGASSVGFSMYVNNGVGVITSSAPTGQIAEVVAGPVPGLTDGDITWSAIYPDPANMLDAPVEWGIGLRAADASNTYESKLRFNTDADDFSVELQLGKFVANVYTELDDTGPIGTWTPGIPWHVRFRLQGTTLQARAWEEGDAEPANWALSATDVSLAAGTGVYARGVKGSGAAYAQWFGPISADTIPPTVGATAFVTPEQLETYLTSVTFPLLNRPLDCGDWDALSRDSRAGFFDIKGRHEILAIADVGSSSSFTLTFVTDTNAELLGVRALLTYGGILYLQPPGDVEEDCPTDFSGVPDGYVMWDGSIERHSLRGTNIRGWTVGFTRVAASDLTGIIPTTITWQMLWDMIGPDGTWEDVWAMWPTWQDLWLAEGDISSFGEVL